ncbi:MAG TPA: TonB-dependent receptor [Polyangiaceae bacterium LLY-WYZ-14_1]|nr:TonB-dependent receptor [Polyangiaceae bacterium LLY-WYZ-14_1]
MAAQESGSLLGRVRHGASPVADARVVIVRGATGREVASTATDGEGRFAMSFLAAGPYTLRVERIGYAELVREVTIAAGQTTEVELTLQLAAVLLEGVSVASGRSEARTRFEEVAGVTARVLSSEELKLVPGIGEADPIRAIEVLPGVVSTSDFSAAFNVRGGSADQNLILLDGVPIFSPFHLGGFFSVFNADMVESAELQSGGFAARHGGRVSSVLTVDSDPGDGAFSVDGGVSVLAARAAVSGGVGPVRFRVSGRRSYFDQLLAPFVEFPYHLQDLQFVAETAVGSRSRLRVSAYTGRDVLDLTRLDAEDFPLRIQWDWGNDVAGATWSWDLGGAGTLDLAGSASRYASDLGFPDFDDTDIRTEIRQGRIAADWTVPVSGLLELSAGASRDAMQYDNLFLSGGTTFGQGAGDGTLLGGYASARIGRPGEWLVEAGLRADRWVPDQGSTVTELSPRLALKHFFGGGDWALKLAGGRYTQFLHSVRDEELPIGLDVWVLAGPRAPHVVSDQVQFGVEAFPSETWSWSADVFYREFDGVITFNTGDDPNSDLDDFLPGEGVSWGSDLFLRRSGEGITGWLSLSFLKADRTFPDLLSPERPAPRITYAPIFDRRVDLDLVVRVPTLFGWSAGFRLNVGSGTPYTQPLTTYANYVPGVLENDGRSTWSGADEDDGGDFAVLLGDRNGERYPVYHRLDVSLRRTFEKSWGTITPHIDVLNLYNRRNVLFYSFQYQDSPPVRSGISMFPLLPTIGVEVAF